MADWLKLILVAAAVMVGLWALLIILAARLPPGLLKDLAGFLPAAVEAPGPTSPNSTCVAPTTCDIPSPPGWRTLLSRLE